MNKTYPCQIIIKTVNIQLKETLLKTAKEKGKVTRKRRPIRIPVF